MGTNSAKRRDFVADVILSGVLPWLCVFVLQRAGVTLIVPRPLMFYLGRQTATRGDPVAVAEWNARCRARYDCLSLRAAGSPKRRRNERRNAG